MPPGRQDGKRTFSLFCYFRYLCTFFVVSIFFQAEGKINKHFFPQRIEKVSLYIGSTIVER